MYRPSSDVGQDDVEALEHTPAYSSKPRRNENPLCLRYKNYL